MEKIAKILTNRWKEIIESILIDDYSREISSIDLFRITGYYHNCDNIEYCYKVNFNFKDCTLSKIPNEESIISIGEIKKTEIRKTEDWNRELKNIFCNIFCKEFNEDGQRILPYFLNTRSRCLIQNDKADYIDNQSSTFIIQFYPEAFLSEIRNEKLSDLGI